MKIGVEKKKETVSRPHKNKPTQQRRVEDSVVEASLQNATWAYGSDGVQIILDFIPPRATSCVNELGGQSCSTLLINGSTSKIYGLEWLVILFPII